MNDCTTVCIDSFEVKNVNRSRQIFCYFSAVGLLILILDGKTALFGAEDGIELCVRTVIPALFPFFVLSSAFLCGMVSIPRAESVFSLIFGLPKGAASLALPCFLGGYPVGAQAVYQAYADGHLPKSAAERLLAFCNNAGPAFVFGVLGQMFPKPWMPWALWGIHIAGAILAAHWVPMGDTAVRFDDQGQKAKGDIMSGAVGTMGIVCGWIVLFRVLIAFLDKWFLWLLPQAARAALVGLLELSNGCCELVHIPDIGVRFVLCSGMLAAGGLCVTAQTFSVTRELSVHYYFLGKLIQFLASLVLSCSLMYKTVLPLPLLLLPFLHRICKKSSRNPALYGV